LVQEGCQAWLPLHRFIEAHFPAWLDFYTMVPLQSWWLQWYQMHALCGIGAHHS